MIYDLFVIGLEQETTTCVRARREDLSSNQASAAASNLSEIGGIYVPLLASWCSELLPEIADEEEVRKSMLETSHHLSFGVLPNLRNFWMYPMSAKFRR